MKVRSLGILQFEMKSMAAVRSATAGLIPNQIINGKTGSLANVSFAANALANSQRLAKGNDERSQMR